MIDFGNNNHKGITPNYLGITVIVAIIAAVLIITVNVATVFNSSKDLTKVLDSTSYPLINSEKEALENFARSNYDRIIEKYGLEIDTDKEYLRIYDELKSGQIVEVRRNGNIIYHVSLRFDEDYELNNTELYDPSSTFW